MSNVRYSIQEYTDNSCPECGYTPDGESDWVTVMEFTGDSTLEALRLYMKNGYRVIRKTTGYIVFER